MNHLNGLSQRERQVAELLLQGQSNKQIALQLSIAQRTVEFHLQNCYAKLQVGSRVELILKLRPSTGTETADLREPTVERALIQTYHSHEPTSPKPWVQSLRQNWLVIKKELAMTKKAFVTDVTHFLQNHLVGVGVLLWIAASLMVRYVVLHIGLYFWVSYALIGLVLTLGSLYLGRGLRVLGAGQLSHRAAGMVAAWLLLPLGVAAVDWVLLYTVAKWTGEASVSLPGLVNEATWRTTADGFSYLHRQRLTSHDTLWLWTAVYMLLLVILGRQWRGSAEY